MDIVLQTVFCFLFCLLILFFYFIEFCSVILYSDEKDGGRGEIWSIHNFPLYTSNRMEYDKCKHTFDFWREGEEWGRRVEEWFSIST